MFSLINTQHQKLKIIQKSGFLNSFRKFHPVTAFVFVSFWCWAGSLHAGGDSITIHLAPDSVGTLFGVPITNTLLTVWLAMTVLFVLALVINANMKLIPSKLQSSFEALIGSVFDYMTEVLESRDLAKKFFPLVMTIFLFILVMNWVGLLPGVDAIGIHTEVESHEIVDGVENKFIPFFHPAATDLNITIAFALIAFVSIELAGVLLLGLFKYGGKFINFSSPLAFVIGLIELISELARLISFSFRLFGNIFAGKTLILVAMFFVPYILPVPLLAFEVFVGFIQAFIFAILTLFFIKIAIEEPH
ncbi:F0F1 ATP synthase subunit A [Candidatus Pacebacteria bacterium]|nr:F0F1 ATP synthase subunit A [Candidatus Paceibacterota bacterium]